MRQLLRAVPIAALAALGASMGLAQDGAPSTVSRSYDLAGFDGISVVGPHRVSVSVGPGFSIRAEGSQRTFDDTEVAVVDGELRIRPVDDERWERRCEEGEGQRNNDGRPCRNDYVGAAFHITLPRLAAAQLAGGGDMQVDRVEGGSFAASLAGSGELGVASLRVEEARFSVAGSGNLVARGSARHARVSIAGSGDVMARELTSEDGAISIAGSGNAALTVRNEARVSIIGGGDVEISGPARCAVTRMGGGRVRCGGETVAG